MSELITNDLIRHLLNVCVCKLDLDSVVRHEILLDMVDFLNEEEGYSIEDIIDTDVEDRFDGFAWCIMDDIPKELPIELKRKLAQYLSSYYWDGKWIIMIENNYEWYEKRKYEHALYTLRRLIGRPTKKVNRSTN